MRTELTLQEVLDISADVAKQGTYIERKMVKDILVYQALSGKKIKNKTITVEIYEKYKAEIDKMYETCTNDTMIDAQVNSIFEKEKIDIYREVKEMVSSSLKNIDDGIDKYVKNSSAQGTDLNSILDKMKGMTTKVGK